MIIDKSPDVDVDDNTIKVQYNVNTDEEVWVTINGLIQVEQNQIEDITDDVITLEDGLLENDDDIIVLYTEKE